MAVQDTIEHAGTASTTRRPEFLLALSAMARDKLALAGTIILIMVILITILAPWISPYSPTEAHRDVGRLAPPLTGGHLHGRVVLRNAPWVSLIPGLMIVVVAVACNFAGDGLRDALDPKQRRQR